MDLVQLPQKIKIIDGDLVQLEDQDQDHLVTKLGFFFCTNYQEAVPIGRIFREGHQHVLSGKEYRHLLEQDCRKGISYS